MQQSFRRQYHQLLVASITLLAIFALVLGFFIGYLVRGDGQPERQRYYYTTPYERVVPEPYGGYDNYQTQPPVFAEPLQP